MNEVVPDAARSEQAREGHGKLDAEIRENTHSPRFVEVFRWGASCSPFVRVFDFTIYSRRTYGKVCVRHRIGFFCCGCGSLSISTHVTKRRPRLPSVSCSRVCRLYKTESAIEPQHHNRSNCRCGDTHSSLASYENIHINIQHH